MHAYERDLHLILTSRPRSLSGSALMETALKPNLRPSSFNASLVCRRTRRLLCRNRQQRAEVGWLFCV